MITDSFRTVRSRLCSAVALRLALAGLLLASGTRALAQETDPTFNATTNDVVRTVAVQADGRILIGGWFTEVNGVPKPYLARLMPDGSLDSTFTVAAPDSWVETIVIQPDGRILVGGYFSTIGGSAGLGLVRLNASDGSRDDSFTSPASTAVLSSVTALLLQADGQVVVSGYRQSGPTSVLTVVRFTDSGTVDSGFAPGAPDGLVVSLAQEADGRLLLGGTFRSIGGVARGGLARVDTDGTLDASFEPAVSLGASHGVYALALHPDGRILLGGRFTTVNGQPRNNLAMVDAAGTVDPAFVVTSNNGPADNVSDIVIQPDGRLLVAGNFVGFGTPASSKLARFNDDGTIDTSFVPQSYVGAGCCNGYIADIELQADGKVLAVGSYAALRVARFPAEILTDVPRNLTATISRGVLRLDWQPPTQAVVIGYLIEAGYASGQTALSLPVGNVLSFQAVPPPATYFVRVRTRLATGQSGPSNEVTFSTNVPPEPPLDLLAEVVGNVVSLGWSENPSGMAPSAYEVRAGSASGLSDLAVLRVGPLSPLLRVTPPTGNYFVRVRALNASGASGDSNEVVVSPAPGACSPRPPAPTGLSATTSPGQVTLTWSPSPGAVGYDLEAGTTPGGTEVGRFTLPATPGLSTAAPPGEYFIRLVARSGAGCRSEASPEVSFVVP